MRLKETENFSGEPREHTEKEEMKISDTRKFLQKPREDSAEEIGIDAIEKFSETLEDDSIEEKKVDKIVKTGKSLNKILCSIDKHEKFFCDMITSPERQNNTIEQKEKQEKMDERNGEQKSIYKRQKYVNRLAISTLLLTELLEDLPVVIVTVYPAVVPVCGSSSKPRS